MVVLDEDALYTVSYLHLHSRAPSNPTERRPCPYHTISIPAPIFTGGQTGATGFDLGPPKITAEAAMAEWC
jgi:hypothetical protein